MFSVEKGNCILRACMCVYVFICIENLRERACAACVRERVRESTVGLPRVCVGVFAFV